jgi:hypothetical protein
MKKQTAVEWLHMKLDVYFELFPSEWQKLNQIIEEAKAMEKEQMINTWTEATAPDHEIGLSDAFYIISQVKKAEQYYNETYGGDMMSKQEEPKQYTNEELEGFEDFKKLIKPKQETLEEASWKYNPLKKLDGEFIRHAFKEGAKWQQERMYSEEDMKLAYFSAIQSTGEGWNGEYAEGNNPNIEDKFSEEFKEWFEQFKKNGGDK